MRHLLCWGIACVCTAAMAVDYRWTGNTGTDFEDVGNWEIRSSETWTSATTAPGNGDTVFLEGTPPANQPVFSMDRTLRCVHFSGTGWTLDLNGFTLTFSQQYQSNLHKLLIGSGPGENRIAGTLSTATGAANFEVRDGSTLVVDGTIIRNASGATGNSVFNGDGTLVLAGNAANTTADATISEGTIVLAKADGVNAINAKLRMDGGTIRWQGNDQLVNNDWRISGDSLLDLNGFHEGNKNLLLATDSANNDVGVSGSGGRVATGSGYFQIPNAANENGLIRVHSAAISTAVIEGRLLVGVPASGTGSILAFEVGDGASDIDLHVAADIQKGFNSFWRVEVNACLTKTNSAHAGETTAGVVAFSGDNSYDAATLVGTGILAVNSQNGSGTGTQQVQVQSTGMLMGNGFILPKAGQTVRIDGTLAGGCPGGTLTLGSSETNTVLQLRDNSTLLSRINLGAEEKAGSVMVNGNVTIGTGVALTVELTGRRGSAAYRLPILSWTGTFTGDFDSGLITLPDMVRLDMTQPGEIAVFVPPVSTLFILK